MLKRYFLFSAKDTANKNGIRGGSIFTLSLNVFPMLGTPGRSLQFPEFKPVLMGFFRIVFFISFKRCKKHTFWN